jgi:hypothetical protein
MNNLRPDADKLISFPVGLQKVSTLRNKISIIKRQERNNFTVRTGARAMIHVTMTIEGMEADFDACRQFTRILAGKENPETMLVAWSDRKQSTHSPCCLKCTIGNEPGWEVYGRNHGGRLRFSINRDKYVFIYS